MIFLEELKNRYKEETKDWLIEDIDKFQRFVEQHFDESLRKTCNIRFEGNPRIIANVLAIHKAINKEKEDRLFHFGQSEIETISLASHNTHMLKTIIPAQSYLVYIVDNDVDVNDGWIGLNIDNVLTFCRIGENEDNFRYRYDAKLNDFHIQFKCLRRKFGCIDPGAFQTFQLPEITFKGRATVKLRELLKNVLKPAYDLDFEGIQLQLAYNQLIAFGSKHFGEDGLDELDEVIKTENWNGEIVKSNYTVPLVKNLVELLCKCFSVADISFSDDGEMRISCGKMLGDEDDDLFLAEMIIAHRTEKEDDEEDTEEEE